MEEKEFAILPSGIYFVPKDKMTDEEWLKQEIYNHNMTFPVIEAMVNYLFLQQSGQIEITLGDGTKVSLALTDVEE